MVQSEDIPSRCKEYYEELRGLDAKRIKSQNETNELRSVLEWHPAAYDVGDMFSSLTPINSTLPALESTVFLYLLG